MSAVSLIVEEPRGSLLASFSSKRSDEVADPTTHTTRKSRDGVLYLPAPSLAVVAAMRMPRRNVPTHVYRHGALVLFPTMVNFDVIMPAFPNRTSTLCSSLVARAAMFFKIKGEILHRPKPPRYRCAHFVFKYPLDGDNALINAVSRFAIVSPPFTKASHCLF